MTKIKWFITYSDKGDCPPNGFYCHECFDKLIYPSDYKEIDPENGVKYECDGCKKDYRDETHSEKQAS